MRRSRLRDLAIEVAGLGGYGHPYRLTSPEFLHFLEHLVERDERCAIFAVVLFTTGLDPKRLEAARRCSAAAPHSSEILIDADQNALRYRIQASRINEATSEWKDSRLGEVVLYLPPEMIAALPDALDPFARCIAEINRLARTFAHTNPGPTPRALRISASFEVEFAGQRLTRLEQAYLSGSLRRDTQTASHYLHLPVAVLNAHYQSAFRSFVATRASSSATRALDWLEAWRIPPATCSGIIEYRAVDLSVVVQVARELRKLIASRKRGSRQSVPSGTRPAQQPPAAHLIAAYRYIRRSIALARRGLRVERTSIVVHDAIVFRDKTSHAFRERRMLPVPADVHGSGENLTHAAWVQILRDEGLFEATRIHANFGRHYAMSRLHGRVSEIALYALLGHYICGFGLMSPYSTATWELLHKVAAELQIVLGDDNLEPAPGDPK